MHKKYLAIICLFLGSCSVKIHHDILATNINGLDAYQIQCPYSTGLHDKKFDLPQEKTCMANIEDFCSSGFKIHERHQGISKMKSSVIFVTFTCDNKPTVLDTDKEADKETTKSWLKYIPFLN